MEFTDVQEFFKSWGLFPSEEDTGDLNRDAIDHGINRPCYRKMVAEANDNYGGLFAQFCEIMVDAQDDSFYLQASTWAEVEAAWGRHTA